MFSPFIHFHRRQLSIFRSVCTVDIIPHSLTECQFQRRVGYTIENPALYADMTTKENLEVFCLQKGISKSEIPDILKLVDLADTPGKK